MSVTEVRPGAQPGETVCEGCIHGPACRVIPCRDCGHSWHLLGAIADPFLCLRCEDRRAGFESTTTAPRWAAVDDPTSDLLALVATGPLAPADVEWDTYVYAVKRAADDAGIVRPNVLRPMLRGVIKPNRIGAYTRRALASGLLERTGDWEISDDREGRNSGRPAPIMRLRT